MVYRRSGLPLVGNGRSRRRNSRRHGADHHRYGCRTAQRRGAAGHHDGRADDGAAGPGSRARSADLVQPDAFDSHARLDDVYHPAGAVERVPFAAVAADAAAAVSEHIEHAADSFTGPGGNRRGGARYRGVRKLRRRRQLHHRGRDFHPADRDSVRGDQPRRGAHLGSDGALHPRCAAGQADEHRFGFERRADRRDRSPAAAGRGHPRGRVLRGHGRRGAFHAARRHRQHHHHGGEHRRRVSDRRFAARHGAERGAQDLHHPDGRAMAW